ncbi:MAG: hypothetical protein AAGJ93_13535 [Bacteroidota bacterium]
MKKALFFVLNLVLVMFRISQNTSLNFNGTSDYLDLGHDAGNGIRTIEMWFKLNEPINPQLNDFSTLAAKDHQ